MRSAAGGSTHARSDVASAAGVSTNPTVRSSADARRRSGRGSPQTSHSSPDRAELGVGGRRATLPEILASSTSDPLNSAGGTVSCSTSSAPSSTPRSAAPSTSAAAAAAAAASTSIGSAGAAGAPAAAPIGSAHPPTGAGARAAAAAAATAGGVDAATSSARLAAGRRGAQRERRVEAELRSLLLLRAGLAPRVARAAACTTIASTSPSVTVSVRDDRPCRGRAGRDRQADRHLRSATRRERSGARPTPTVRRRARGAISRSCARVEVERRQRSDLERPTCGAEDAAHEHDSSAARAPSRLSRVRRGSRLGGVCWSKNWNCARDSESRLRFGQTAPDIRTRSGKGWQAARRSSPSSSAHTQVVAGTNLRSKIHAGWRPPIRVYEQLRIGFATVTSRRPSGTRAIALGVYAVLQDGEEHAMDAADFGRTVSNLRRRARVSGSPLLVGLLCTARRRGAPLRPAAGAGRRRRRRRRRAACARGAPSTSRRPSSPRARRRTASPALRCSSSSRSRATAQTRWAARGCRGRRSCASRRTARRWSRAPTTSSTSRRRRGSSTSSSTSRAGRRPCPHVRLARRRRRDPPRGEELTLDSSAFGSAPPSRTRPSWRRTSTCPPRSVGATSPHHFVGEGGHGQLVMTLLLRRRRAASSARGSTASVMGAGSCEGGKVWNECATQCEPHPDAPPT